MTTFSWKIGDNTGAKSTKDACEEMFRTLRSFQAEHPDAPRRVNARKSFPEGKYTIAAWLQRVADETPRIRILKVRDDGIVDKTILDVYSLSGAVLCVSVHGIELPEELSALETIAAELSEILTAAL